MEKKVSVDSNMKKYLMYFLFLSVPLIEIFCFQYLLLGDIEAAKEWYFNKPWNVSVTYILILICQYFVYMVINNLYIGLILPTFIFVLLNLINYYKMQFLGAPLFPWDLTLGKEMLETLPDMKDKIEFKYVIILFVGLIVFLISIRFVPKIKMKHRAIKFVIFAIVIGCYILNKPTVDAYLKEKKVGNVDVSTTLNLKWNGFVYGFYNYIPDAIIKKPKNYEQEKIEETINEYDLKYKKTSKVTVENPNIILIMSESYYDITKLKDLELEEDVLSNTHALQKGEILSPTYGGGTSTVEFEALTGLSMNFLREGTVPYQQYVERNTLSLPSILKEKGYDTRAIHTYTSWYWNRVATYENFGFNKFLAMQDMPEDLPRYGKYFDDININNYIKQHIEETEQPTFTFAVTMQNHTPYSESYYEDSQKITFNKEDFSKETASVMGGFLSGVAHSDDVLGELVTYIENLEEPTLLYFFGDHLPGLGTDYAAYIENGNVTSSDKDQWTLDEKTEMHSTPLIIASNYEIDKDVPQVMSPSFLSAYILEDAGIELPPFQKFLSVLSNNLPGITHEIKIDAEQNITKEIPKEYKELLEDYELFQYDILHGDEYIRNINK